MDILVWNDQHLSDPWEMAPPNESVHDLLLCQLAFIYVQVENQSGRKGSFISHHCSHELTSFSAALLLLPRRDLSI